MEATVKTTKQHEVTLTLSETEAKLVSAFVQNKHWDNEDPIITEFRQELFQALNPPMEGK